MVWQPENWQPLPSNEWLLAVADYCHNLTGNRGYGTFAVGAVGETPLRVTLVIGVNSSAFHETKLTPDQNVPPVVRNAAELQACVMTKEPYHAEVSCVLWAKANSMKLFTVASSRKVCSVCNGFLGRNASTTKVVDGWQTPDGKYLTHEQRTDVNLSPAWVSRMGGPANAKAVLMK
jgi:hypothetical protein